MHDARARGTQTRKGIVYFRRRPTILFLALHPLAGCFRALLTNIVTKVGRGKKFPTRTKAIISYVTACERGRERERRSLENWRGPLVCCASTTNLFSRGLEWLTDPTNWARIMVGFFSSSWPENKIPRHFFNIPLQWTKQAWWPFCNATLRRMKYFLIESNSIPYSRVWPRNGNDIWWKVLPQLHLQISKLTYGNFTFIWKKLFAHASLSRRFTNLMCNLDVLFENSDWCSEPFSCQIFQYLSRLLCQITPNPSTFSEHWE